MKTWDVVIIGGGVIGLSLAWRLRQHGVTVVIVEKGEPAREATYAAGGMIVDPRDSSGAGRHDDGQCHLYPERARVTRRGLRISRSAGYWNHRLLREINRRLRRRLRTLNGNWLELSGDTGFYQPQPQLLDLFGNVALYQDKGNEFHSTSAHLDMNAGTAEGDDPVTGQGPFGHVTAQGFRILNRGDTIYFTGHARLDMAPRQGLAR